MLPLLLPSEKVSVRRGVLGVALEDADPTRTKAERGEAEKAEPPEPSDDDAAA